MYVRICVHFEKHAALIQGVTVSVRHLSMKQSLRGPLKTSRGSLKPASMWVS